MSMTKWEGKPQVAHACLWLFYEQALNINASGTRYEVERNKVKDKMQAGMHTQRGQNSVEGKDGRRGK